MRKWILLCLMLILCGIGMNAQKQLSGRVMDGAMPGEPLIGASVQVPGSTAGTLTDLDGYFSFTLPEGKVLVQVSMIGYKTQVINVKEKSTIEVTLMEDVKEVDEVVVVGYGTMKKRDLSGAITQIKGSDLLKGGSTDLAHGMQGKIAGVQVQQNDGAPGAGVSITVRGANSNAKADPLYIVDGIPFDTGDNMVSLDENNHQTTNPLSLINPNDIEKIEVLKDASATAIYGARGSNGVVIITTRKGKTGKPRVELTANFSMQKIGKRVKMLDAYTYGLYRNEQMTNGNTYEGGNYQLAYSLDEEGHWESGNYKPSLNDLLHPRVVTDGMGHTQIIANTDWQDEIYQTGWQQEYNVSVSGGGDQGWYSFSGNYLDQDGIIKKTGFRRYGINISLGYHVTDWLELGTSNFVTHSVTDFQRTNSSDYSIIRSAMLFMPTLSPDTETATLDEYNWLATNPASYVSGSTDRTKTMSWFSSSYAEARITPWLKFRQNLGLGYNDNHRNAYYDRHTYEARPNINGKAIRVQSSWRSMTAESVFTFDKRFGIHNINAVAGMTFDKGIGESTKTTVTNFPFDYNTGADLSMGLDKPVLESGASKQTLESFLARINYTLMDKYLFTASIRTDGSSKFSSNNKWATFMSGAIAWRASEENFIRDLNIFSNLKFRLSYGETGNQNSIGAYSSVSRLTDANYAYGNSLSSGVSMIDWNGPVNPNLKWETTAQFNAGIDFGFLNQRLQLTIDYYYKRTRDLLQRVSLPLSYGYSNMQVNNGNVTNEGLEISLSYDVLKNMPVKWNINANITFNKNKMGGLDGDQFSTSLWDKADQVFLQRNGCPMGTLYGYVEDGFFDNIGEVLAMKQYAGLSYQDALKYVGEIKYRDYDGDGYITDEDRRIIGDTNPEYVFGITNTVQWKEFTLDFMLQGSHGNDIFNANLCAIEMGNIGNITQDAYNGRWTEATKDVATWPKAVPGYTRQWKISNRYVEDGSYVKLKYITLAYDWRKPFLGIENIKFSLTATNLFCITKYSWFDPDVNAFASDPARRGVDMFSYPSARTFSLGIHATF